MTEPLEVMEHLVTLTYREELPPNTVRFGEALIDGRIIGQKCPSCGRVYLPPKDFCPLDVIVLGPKNDVEVADHGVVTGFTIITPVRYYGQTKTEPFIYASVLLDGSDATLGGQDISGLPADQVRVGLQVKAVWKPKDERGWEGMSTRGWGSVVGSIDSFEATGEPDVPRERFLEHVL
jgi:uncharacterized OB-fold protein